MDRDDAGHEAGTLDCIVAIAGGRARIPGGAIVGFASAGEGDVIHGLGTAVLLDWHGDLVPVVPLAEGPGVPLREAARSGVLVVVRQPAPDGPKALLADAVVELAGGAGGTVPVPAIVSAYAGEAVAVPGTAEAAEGDWTAPESFLEVTCGGAGYLIPAAAIRRIEAVPASGFQPCGAGLAVLLPSGLLPVAPLFGCVPGAVADQSLVVVEGRAGPVALAVDGLGDIVEPGDGPRLAWNRDGVVEARVVGGRALGVVDLAAATATVPVPRDAPAPALARAA